MKTSRHNPLPTIIFSMLMLTAVTIVSMSFATTGVASNTSFGSSSTRAQVNASLFADAGDLDPSFDGDGKVTTDIVKPNTGSEADLAHAVAIQPDGAIVVAGSRGGCNVVARYTSGGRLDLSFGVGGVVTPDINCRGDNGLYAVAIQPDGKIVVVGTLDFAGDQLFIAYRYNSNGSYDPTFSSNGQGYIFFRYAGGNPETSVANAVAIQSDGKIVMAGYTIQGSIINFAVARLTSDGTLDTTFDGNGLLTTDFFGNSDEARAVAIQPDGKIVAVGYTRVSGSNYDFALARYNSNGSLDSTFGGDGKVNTDFLSGGDDEAYAMAIQPDGKIVAAGGVQTISTGYDFGVARYNSNGSLDTGFPGGGFAAINFSGNDYTEIANGVALQSDGKIVLAGYAPGNGFDFALARLMPDGSLDTSFSGDGMVTTDFGGDGDSASALAIQPDGNIVAVGQTNASGDNDFALARYLSVAPPTPTPTITNTPTITPTPTITNTPTNTPTITPTNTPLPPRGCAAGFWQGGTGLPLWNQPQDPQWDGRLGQPYYTADQFNSFFSPYAPFANQTMLDLVNGGGGGDKATKAAREVVAAYLNAARYGAAFPYSAAQIQTMWANAVNSNDFKDVHTTLTSANNSVCAAP